MISKKRNQQFHDLPLQQLHILAVAAEQFDGFLLVYIAISKLEGKHKLLVHRDVFLPLSEQP